MKKNIVSINLEDYNELRDFKKDIEDGFTYVVETYFGSYLYKIISTDEALKKMGWQIEKLRKENAVLKTKCKNQSDIEIIKKMNWWRFRKWKAGKI